MTHVYLILSGDNPYVPLSRLTPDGHRPPTRHIRFRKPVGENGRTEVC